MAGRAFRLIADGLVDREGVPGLAARLGFSERHLNRILTEEVGAGPVALARAQRSQAARTLVESTELPFAEVALAAGFGSVRQFNDTIRAIYARTPTELRRRARDRRNGAAAGTIELRLPARRPFDGHALVDFLRVRAVPGLESVEGGTYRRALSLERGSGLVELTADEGGVRCLLRLDELGDLTAAVARCRRLFDLDADPEAVVAQLGEDPILAPLVHSRPGLRVPGTVDGFELAVRAIVGQQVTVSAARTILGRLVAMYGEPLGDRRPAAGDSAVAGGDFASADGPSASDRAPRSAGAPPSAPTHRFPTAAALVELDPEALPFPRTRAEALRGLARAVAEGKLDLDAGADPDATRAALLAIRGIGPWTASYVAVRALGDPDGWPVGDVGIRHALERLGLAGDQAAADAAAEAWRPWRSYAVLHLWSSLGDQPEGASGTAYAATATK